MKEFRGRKPKMELKEKINKLVAAGFSFQDIANILNLKSRQLVRFHFLTYRKMIGEAKVGPVPAIEEQIKN